MPRHVTLVVTDAAGTPVGRLPAFDVDLPYWPQTSDVVEHVRTAHGVELDVLRLVDHEQPHPQGGAVTYLAQLRPGAQQPGLEPVLPQDLCAAAATDPLRAPYADPGGPAASLAWAEGVLGPVRATQQRTWNLSAIWRLTTADGRTVWLKQLPAFLRTETVVLQWFRDNAPHLAPELMAAGEHGRQLLAHVEGTHHYDGGADRVHAVCAAQHELHLLTVDAAGDLVARGVEDLTGPRLAGWLRHWLAPHLAAAPGHPAADLLAGAQDRLALVQECGLPAVLCHGDNNPGNAIGHDTGVVFLDWGEAFLGNPALDVIGLLDGLPAGVADGVLQEWARRWRRDVPGCDPLRAVELLRPLSALEYAATYARFLTGIEASERAYHEADVPQMLDAAAGSP